VCSAQKQKKKKRKKKRLWQIWSTEQSTMSEWDIEPTPIFITSRTNAFLEEEREKKKKTLSSRE